MSTMSSGWGWLLGFAIGSAYSFSANSVQAQISPDGTLPNNTIVTSDGNTFNITGGTQAGTNLFHSFQEFSVPTGSEAIFNNAVDIQNIISRVTGGSISNIDGLISANGLANLFLINPGGIVFGQNARLNIGGSFVASTASSLRFADGFEFSAANSQATPLLIISVPTGLQFGGNPGNIVVQGDGQSIRTTDDLINTDTGLQVLPNQTLALVGGNVVLEGGMLSTPGGRIELGSVTGEGKVSLTPTNKGWALGYEGVSTFENIHLFRQAIVDASGEGGGDVQVRTRQLTLTDGSQIEASTLGSGQGGSLVVNAQESLEIIGTTADGQFGSGLYAQVFPRATGTGGNLTVDTNVLLVRDGGVISVATVGQGRGGNLTVNASKEVQLIGTANGRFPSGVSASSQPGATGEAGDLTINTGRLLVRDGAQVSAGTFAAGNGGNLTVNASQVQLIGTTANSRAPSGLFVSATRGSTGEAGDLTINTSTLLVRDGAQITAGTFSQGGGGNLTVNSSKEVQLTGTSVNGRISSGLFTSTAQASVGAAGDLTINTGKLLVQDGAIVTVGTVGTGNGGNLTVTASQVELIGTSADGRVPSGLFASTQPTSTGNAGDLMVNTQQLLVQDGAMVSVRSLGTGTSGNLIVDARSIRLDNTGTISATSASGNGGNIALVVGDLLLLRRGSQISATAGIDGAGGDGGNITINAPNGFIVSVNNENNDITANAFEGSGGVIRIISSGNFNIQQRERKELEQQLGTDGLLDPQLLPTNDITAFSQNNPILSGQINISTLDIDQNLGLVELPAVLADTSDIIDTGCSAIASTIDAQGSKFVVTGRGGLPPSPDQPLSTDVVWSDTRLAAVTSQQQDSKKPATQLQPQLDVIKINPAVGWVFDNTGNATLISHASNNVRTTSASCKETIK
jgi:filamentous hemagglutinin family protein